MKKQFIYFLAIALVITSFSCSKDEGDVVQEPVKSSAKQITGFEFKANENEALTEDVPGVINEQDKTISATVANGTDIKSLTPTVQFSEKAILGQTGAKDFSSPVDYTITAEDGTKTTYKVSISVALASAKQITSFIFYNDESESLEEDVVATIDEVNNIITAIVPHNTNRAILVPNIKISTNATIAPEGMQDFTNAIPYIVTAEDGTETTYTVTANTELNSAKQIISFVYGMAENPELLEDVEITIDEEGKLILDYIPSYIKSSSLLPTIEISEGATITKSQDFYTVTAEDGSTQEYTLFEAILASPRYVLIELFRDNPENTLTWDITQQDISNWEGVTTNLEGNITELRLPNKNINKIPVNFEFLNALKLLYLSFNQITTLPDELRGLNQLNYLDMSGNNFAEIPNVIWGLEGLKALSITQMDLTNIPQEITQLSNLSSLNLNNNDITTLPSYLKEIPIIDLRNNKITAIPAEISNFTKLRRLYLSDNKIRIIPSNIGALKELVILSLDNNDIRSISKDIGLLPKLEELLLENNDLLSLPKEIGNLHTLKLIKLTLNPNLLSIPIEICDLSNFGTNVRLDNQTTCQ